MYVSAGLHSILILGRFNRITQTGRPSRNGKCSQSGFRPHITNVQERNTAHFYGVLPIFRGLSFDVGSVDIQHFKNGRRNGFTQDAVSFGVEMAPWVDVELFRAPGKYQCLVSFISGTLPLSTDLGFISSVALNDYPQLSH